MPFRFLSLPLLFLIFLTACDNGKKKLPTDTLAAGTIAISVDETYKPVIEAQLHVFDSSYPDAHINAAYKPESECIRDFLDGKVRMILVTRELNDAEKKYCRQSLIDPTTLSVARDAVAVIVNPASADTSISLDQLKGILTGQYSTKYTVVFDNQGSSTVRYVTDSILKGQALGANVYAAKSNPDVIDYVSKNKNAIGLIGQSYVSTDEDSAYGGSFIHNVKVVAMQSPEDGFVKPLQAYVAMRAYPLTRNLYYINRETYMGLGTGFSNFLAQQRGQLVFKQSHMFPLRSEIIIRQVQLNR